MSDRTCGTCGMEFEFPCQLERHISSKRKCKPKEQQLKDYMCIFCKNYYSNKFSLSRHQNTCKIKDNGIQTNHTTTSTSIIPSQNNNLEVAKITKPNTNLDVNNTINTINNITNFLKKLSDTNNNHDFSIIMQDIAASLKSTIEYSNPNKSLDDEKVVSIISKYNTLLQNNNDNRVVNINNQNNSKTSTMNNTLNNILNKNTTQHQTQNNVLTNNSNNNNNNNITTNNNISLPNIINPFGCEDISFITDDEKLEILKSYNGVELALEKVYSKPENRNFYKPNANKDNVSILNKDMKIQVKKQKQFNEQMLNHGILVMERMFYSCKNRLSFEHQLLIWNNIEENRDLLRFESNITQILSIMETCFQDAISKEIFKKFSDKINREETFRLEKINIVKELLLELERFNNDRNNVTINDDFLRNEVWSKEEKNESDVDSSDSKNNLAIRHLVNTPRFKFFEEMKLNEFEYFDMHGASIGNIIEYRKILIQRAKAEIERITAEYKNHNINDNGNLTNEVKDKLITEPRLQMRTKLANVEFNDKNLLEDNLEDDKSDTPTTTLSVT